MKANIAHMKKMFLGLENDYVYHLESCNVHFPMTLKVEGNKLVINNFLGEKTPRFARILPGVKVDVKGAKITVSSPDKDAAGHTASNFEKATKIKLRDRRVFQDGIFLVDRPGGAK
jgi:large subunit ribosomal protein L6